MASPVEAQVLLCDAAVSDPSGKLHMLGAGWSTIRTPLSPHAVAVLFRIPWDRANQKIDFSLKLVDSDGHPVRLPSPNGPQELGEEGQIEVGRPPGVTPGSPLGGALALSIPPLPLAPGRYEWRLRVAQTDIGTSFEVLGSA
jgi:hypothetical protein